LTWPILFRSETNNMKKTVIHAGAALLFAASLTLAACGPKKGGDTPPPATAESTEGPSHAHGPGGHEHDIDSYIAAMLEPGRDEWQKPAEVMAALELKPNMYVADIGCGPGYFTLPLADGVAPDGIAYAIDVEQRMLDALDKRRFEADEIKPFRYHDRIVPILAEFDDPGLPPGSVDLALIVDTYHHFGDRVDYMKRVATALKPGGRVAIIDFFKKELPVGPPPERKLTRDEVVTEMESAGFSLSASHDFLPYQYFLVFELASGD